ncbi:flagellar basal body L-ring protein FlgH [Sulfurimonas sp. SAG-AH-194-C21]|nr:flagellar basal body L-ring protein FlgH [Sulfurimonas sp. SAG-AH-194-C21]MDF1884363.1 flagellar basal body L-ring protein FlgH [Sulfurimonas sp. SAG-AH-194-C21]
MKNILLTTLTFIFAILTLSGCTAGLTEPEIDFEPPKYVEQMPAREDKKDFASTGSIFGQGDNPLFSDHKAMNLNDIVTVIISETARSSNVGAKQLSESDTSTLGGGVFTTGGATTGTGANGMLSNALGSVNGYTNAGFNTSSEMNYNGQGSATKDASFTTTISARVVKILQNGNYFISGKREILIDDQKQIIQISGVIRPYDIDQNNNINSSQMSEAKILYKTEGDVERATKQGWGTKAIQAVWPF